jgi:hypothetical protein
VSNRSQGVDTRPFSLHCQSDYAEREWLIVGSKRRLAELGAKAAATLRCVRRGVPAPNAAAAATSERSERKRRAGRSRGGRGRGTISCTCEKVTPESRESNGSGFYDGDSA